MNEVNEVDGVVMHGYIWEGNVYKDGSSYDRWGKADKFIVKQPRFKGRWIENYAVYTTKNSVSNKRISTYILLSLNDAINFAETIDA